MDDIEKLLVERGLTSPETLDLARLEAAKNGYSVWLSLVKLGYLTETQLMVFFAQESGIAYINLSDYRIAPEVLHLLDEHFCRQNTVIPVCKINDLLYLACSNPLDPALVDAAGKHCGLSVEPLFATTAAITAALDYYWRLNERNFSAGQFISRKNPLKGVGFWRESERLFLSLPVMVAVRDQGIALAPAQQLKAQAQDISRNAKAIGIACPVFLPRGVSLFMEFDGLKRPGARQEEFCATGEIIRCFMLKEGDYFLGVTLGELDPVLRQRLLEKAFTRNTA